MRLLLATVAFGLFAAPAWAIDVPTATIINGAIDGYIRPAFKTFDGDAAALKADVATLCAAPSAPALTAAQVQFKLVVTSYSKLEFLRLGPLGVEDRAERLLFWPDTKGIALKQVQSALAAKDPAATDPKTLRKKSVAMQGLGAAEFLLFGTGSETLATGDGGYRCSFAAAVTSLVSDLAATLDTEWQDTTATGPAAAMLDPKPDAQDYRTPQEVMEKLAGSLIVGTEVIRDQRLAPVIGASEGKPKPKSALFWRSGMSVPSVAAGFAGLRGFFVAATLPETLKTLGAAWISNGALFEFDNAAMAAAKITDPIDVAVNDQRQFQALNYLVNLSRTLDTLLGENLPSALGLTTGFSQLDGD
jgi:predicted lipoprotein